MSDAAPLIIGSGSKFGGGSRARGGSNFRGGPKFGNGAGRRGPKGGNPNRRPRESVRVWLGNAEVGEIALGVLTRFSKAKDAFPRLEAEKEVKKEVKASASGSAGKAAADGGKKASKAPANDSTGKTEKEGKKAAKAPATASASKAVAGSSKKASKAWADDDDTNELIVVEDADATSATNSPAKDTPSTDSSTRSPSNRTASSKFPAADPSTKPVSATPSPGPTVPKNFYLHNEAWVQPKLPQLQHVLAWIETNKTTRHGESLMPLIPTSLETLSTTALVDIYAAVTAFDLTPFPHSLRHGILSRLTQEPVTLPQLQYFYDVLQEGDPIVSRLVTSVLEHYEAGNYDEQEYSDIYNWVELPVSEGGVDDNGYLKAHFGRVERSRKRKAREAQRGQSRVQGYEKLKSGSEVFAEPLREALPSVAGATTGATSAKMGATTGATTTGAAEAPGETQEEKRVRRRNRRRPQRGSAGKAAEAGAAAASAGVKGVSVGGSKSAAGGKATACGSK